MEEEEIYSCPVLVVLCMGRLKAGEAISRDILHILKNWLSQQQNKMKNR